MRRSWGILPLVMQMQKVYVKVIVAFSPEGQTTPLRMDFNDRLFDIDHLIRVERAAPQSGGGGFLRYTVKIWGQTRYLWRDGDRWFVEVPG